MHTATAHFTSPYTTVLIASANPEFRNKALRHFASSDWRVMEAQGGADALCKLEDAAYKMLLLDHQLPDLRAEDLVGIVESRYPGTDVVLLDSQSGRPMFPDEPDEDEVYRCFLGEIDEPKNTEKAAAMTEALPGMIGQSAGMQRLYRLARLVARRTSTVLICGETGTGKELVAQAIHQLSPRVKAPLVTVNCAAIPEALLEAELFGYTRGAFTGAVQARIGKIHAAQGGTLFLDEIGEMEPGVQAKILRFLENGEVQRLGSPDVFKVDVRVVAATNAKLTEKIANGRFREDLLYRLAVFPIDTPPLRDGGDDILALARYFLATFSDRRQTLSSASEEILRSHRWPGNVRELKHVVERASILADERSLIEAEDIVLLTSASAALNGVLGDRG